MATKVPPFSSAVGLFSTIDCFGHSLMHGDGNLSGMTPPAQLQSLFPARIVNNRGIGGQVSAQIASRQGGLPVTLTVAGNSLPANYAAASVTSISSQMLSTGADNAARYHSGQINGNPCVLERLATGGPPSTTETYNIYNGVGSAVAIPARALFIPDDGWNARHSVQVLWMSNNDDLSNLTGPLANVAACYAYVSEPKRVVVVGEHSNPSSAIGSLHYNQVQALNAALQATYPVYVTSDPPTDAEMTAVGYTPTTQDRTDIGNGVWPVGLRSGGGDTVHLVDAGYQIMGNRIGAAITANGW